MTIKRTLPLLLSVFLATSCAKSVPVLAPALQNYNVHPYGEQGRIIKLAAGRTLDALMKDLKCGEDGRRCDVGDAGRVFVVQIGREFFIVQQSSFRLDVYREEVELDQQLITIEKRR